MLLRVVVIYRRQKKTRARRVFAQAGRLCQVPDLILVQTRVRARSASRGNGCKV